MKKDATKERVYKKKVILREDRHMGHSPFYLFISPGIRKEMQESKHGTGVFASETRGYLPSVAVEEGSYTTGTLHHLLKRTTTDLHAFNARNGDDFPR